MEVQHWRFEGKSTYAKLHLRNASAEADANILGASLLLLKACEDAHAAIQTLPAEALGIGNEGGVTNWSIRDELLYNMAVAIAKAHGEVVNE